MRPVSTPACGASRFFVVPSAVAFLALGDVIVGALFQTGRFNHADSIYVWRILAGSSVGLLASTLGRLYSSTYYALRDTRTPLRYAVIRVALTTVLGYVFAIPLPRWLGLAPEWGAAGLTASAGIAGWVEMLLLRATLNARIGRNRAAGITSRSCGDRRSPPRRLPGASRSRAAAASDRDRARRPRTVRRRLHGGGVPAPDTGSVDGARARR